MEEWKRYLNGEIDYKEYKKQQLTKEPKMSSKRQELKEKLIEQLEYLKDYVDTSLEYVENDEEWSYVNGEIENVILEAQELERLWEEAIDEWEKEE